MTKSSSSSPSTSHDNYLEFVHCLLELGAVGDPSTDDDDDLSMVIKYKLELHPYL